MPELETPATPPAKGKKYRALNAQNFWERLELHFMKPEEEKGGPNGYMFETYGEDMDMVRKVHEEDPSRVLTILDGDSGNQWISHGFHFVNVCGYLLLKGGFGVREFKDFRC